MVWLLTRILTRFGLSPYIYLLVTQLLAVNVKPSNLDGSLIAEREIICHLALRMTLLFLKDSTQIRQAGYIMYFLKPLDSYYLRVHECELLAVKD